MKNLILFLLIAPSLWAQNPRVKTDKGVVEGYSQENLLIFKGIPFAAPPVGSLRWKAPQEAKAWSNILACKDFSASPLQRKPEPFNCWTEEFIAPPQPLSEDCLYLNIWTKNTKKKKPVLVWIYGGGFNSGSAACAIYDGKHYAQNDIVFVSVNYRVNIFGFFAHPGLGASAKGEAACNFGLLDQLQALKWVQKNIAAFGGDPGNVTIMGQSAGSFAVHALVASPHTKGLFHKAIGHSGGILGSNRGISLADAEANGTKFQQQVGVGSFEALQAMPAQELLAKALQYNPAFSPVLDGNFLPSNIQEHYQSKKHNDVPTLTGWVTGDGSFFGNTNMTKESYEQGLKRQYPEKYEALLQLFPAKTDAEAQQAESKRRRLTFGAVPAVLWAQYNSSPSYVYEFDHVPAEKPNFPDFGAFHTADVPFALGTLDTWQRPWRAVDRQMEKMMSRYWINFIKTGNPNGKNLAAWPKYEPRNKTIMKLVPAAGMQPGLYQQELSLLSQ